MSRENFKHELLESAKRKARISNYQFTHDAENNLRELINAGIDRMTFADYSSPGKKRIVEQNLEKLVEYMITNARSRRVYDNLDTRTFSAVRLRICPLWPFC